MTKPELQEEALQLEVSIYYPDGHEKEGKELTVEDLKTAIADKKAQLEAEHQERQAEADAAREGGNDEDNDDEDNDDEEEQEAKPDPKPRKARGKKAQVADPPAERLKLMGCGKPSDKDRSLAAKHGYPVAVPGGKPYRTDVSFNCSLGGGLRPAGSVVILTDEQAEHKKDFITPVK